MRDKNSDNYEENIWFMHKQFRSEIDISNSDLVERTKISRGLPSLRNVFKVREEGLWTELLFKLMRIYLCSINMSLKALPNL